MSDDDLWKLIVSIANVVFTLGAYFTGLQISKWRYRNEAIERGFSEYDQRTGEWKWKGE